MMCGCIVAMISSIVAIIPSDVAMIKGRVKGVAHRIHERSSINTHNLKIFNRKDFSHNDTMKSLILSNMCYTSY